MFAFLPAEAVRLGRDLEAVPGPLPDVVVLTELVVMKTTDAINLDRS